MLGEMNHDLDTFTFQGCLESFIVAYNENICVTRDLTLTPHGVAMVKVVG